MMLNSECALNIMLFQLPVGDKVEKLEALTIVTAVCYRIY